MVALQKLVRSLNVTRECDHAWNPSAQTQAERHQPHCLLVHQFARYYPNRCSWCETTPESFSRTARLFFEAELSIAKSRKSNLHTLREVVVVNAFAGIRTDHRRTQAASYFVELIEVCTEIEHHEPEIFHLLERAFGYLDQYDPDQRAILHFETELARITGVQGAKSNAAMALAHLFGKLPSSRLALLKSLASDKDGS